LLRPLLLKINEFAFAHAIHDLAASQQKFLKKKRISGFERLEKGVGAFTAVCARSAQGVRAGNRLGQNLRECRRAEPLVKMIAS
jgi:hypothetical protein